MFERVQFGEDAYFLKTSSYRTDWLMRMIGDHDYRNYLVWQSGLMDQVPPSIDHAVVGMALEHHGDDALLGILMRDVSDALVPEGDEPISMEQHLRFIDHLAALWAGDAGWRDTLGLTTLTDRLRFFAPETLEREQTYGPVPELVQVAAHGWQQLAERAPDAYATIRHMHTRPGRVVSAISDTPTTFLQGDWKMGNLGSHPDGRTVLLDWAYPGAGPACWDLAWFLALNRARLPMSKEDTINEFRGALNRRGITTDGWFDRQLHLCLLGMVVAIGWEKALGDDDELGWWLDAAGRGMQVLDGTA